MRHDNTIRTWAFYYTINRMDQFVIGTYDCKHPQRTKLYKELKKYWNKEGVTGIGYTTELTDPCHIYPQSPLK